MMISKSEHARRLRTLQAGLNGQEAMLVTKDENVRYLTGINSGRLLVWRDGAKFFLSEVYFKLAGNSSVKPTPQKKDAIRDLVFSKKFKRVGADDISLPAYNALNPKMKRLIGPSDACQELRKIKSKEELKALSKAGSIASAVMRALDESKVAGMTEFELAGLLEYEVRKRGSEVPPFGGGMLCMSGPNSAYPHALVSGRKIKDGDLLILDFGAVVDGYHSDMTRTLEIGKVAKDRHSINAFMGWLKEEAIDRVELGGKIADIHKYVEDEIKKKGYKFYHLTGHGIGLEVHERPSIGPDEKDVFKEGMVFTIEPGIYTTNYGARSEDTIALIGKKKKILTL